MPQTRQQKSAALPYSLETAGEKAAVVELLPNHQVTKSAKQRNRRPPSESYFSRQGQIISGRFSRISFSIYELRGKNTILTERRYKMGRALALTITTLLLISPVASSIAEVLSSKGTLVVIVPNADGLLICADRRSYDLVRGDTDINLKIGRLDKWAAVASTGNTTYLNRPSFAVGFDANKEALEFAASNGFDPSPAYWSALATRIATDLGLYAHQYPGWSLPISPDHVLFQIIFAYIHAKAPHVTVMKFLVYPTGWKAEPMEYGADELSGKLPLSFGNVAVPLELQQGKDPRFDDLRSQVHMKPFFDGTIRAESATLKDAKSYALWLIRVTSERTHLLENSTNHVGPTADCAIISPTKGFSWLSR
jgi:hypothetical protein